jgi:hypothetical protein
MALQGAQAQGLLLYISLLQSAKLQIWNITGVPGGSVDGKHQYLRVAAFFRKKTLSQGPCFRI